MSERKVLNKYYPPDFDPSKIPRMKLPRNRQYTVRLMAPFNMRCKTCGEYIYKGKKFNARKEDVEGEDYLGIRIYRFYIKCTRCLQEISFKTDPKNTDYEIEAGATRNFMALKLAEEQAQREEDEKKEEEASNPMKLLENRTEQSKQELELLESLEELKDLNKRQRSIDFDGMLAQFDSREAREKWLKMQEEEDERYVRSVFGNAKKVIEEVVIEDVDNTRLEGSNKNQTEVASSSLLVDGSCSDERKSDVKIDNAEPPNKIMKISSNDDRSSALNKKNIITTKGVRLNVNHDEYWSKSVGIMSHKSGAAGLSGLVKIKSPDVRLHKQHSEIEPTSCVNYSKTNSTDVTPKVVSQSGVGVSLVGNYGGSSSSDEDDSD